MKKLAPKSLSAKDRKLSFKEIHEPYEIIYANPRDEEIHLKFLKRAQISAHMARWFLDHEYNQLLWSDGIFEILELDSRKYGANFNSFLEVVHPDDRSIKSQAYETLQKTSKPLEINYRLQFNDGRIKWINEICNTDFNKEGQPIRSYGTIQDITKYKLNEENFKLKEGQYNNLIESIPLGIAICQYNKFAFINPAWERILSGNKKMQFIGKSITKMLPPESKKKFRQRIDSVSRGHIEPTFEEKMLRLDGTELYSEVTLTQTRFKDFTAVQISVKDITELKKTEEQLRFSEEKFNVITEYSTDVFWTIDLLGNFTNVSPAIENLLGYRQEELINQNIILFLTSDSSGLAYKEIKKYQSEKLLKEKLGPKKMILESVCKDGRTKWIEIKSGPIYDSNQIIFGYSGVCKDITKRKKTTQFLKKNKIRLKELIETKDKFFTIIAHDLRSPFNSILGFLDLLRKQYDDFDDSVRKGYLKLIEENANNTLKLLDNLLEWAKAQTGKITFQPRRQKLIPIVENAIETLNSALILKELKIDYSIDDNLEIYSDANMLTTIFQNLISNAIKHSYPGGTISINTDLAENQLEVIVSDTGVGMNDETLNRLFQIGEQVSVPGTANEKGSGLGLILCKDFIEMHKGSIWAESEPGKGSKFIFRIPQKIFENL
ncbi:MAG: PAS domain S-box protein [Bacteroidota bacterium]|nr:PAS domain S-box protein [Bacteroidota bacterium]